MALVANSREIELVKKVLRGFIEGEHRNVMPPFDQANFDWGYFKLLAKYHEIFPFSYLALKAQKPLIPEDLWCLMERSFYKTLACAVDFEQEALAIMEAAQGALIQIVPLKGVALLMDLYQKLPLRPMSDIDLLIKKEDLKAVERILEQMGYEKDLRGYQEAYWLNHQYHLTFKKKIKEKLYIVEIHWGLDYPTEKSMILMDLWQRLVSFDYKGGAILMLSPEDTFLSLVLHNRRYGKTLCLKSIYDMAGLLKKYEKSFDWAYVAAQCKKYRLHAAVYFALLQAQEGVGFKVDEHVKKIFFVGVFKKWLMKIFLKKYLFNPKKLQDKVQFVKNYMLLFDDIKTPIRNILNMPQEQFARYYYLDPYAPATARLYRCRILVFLFKRSKLQTN